MSSKRSRQHRPSSTAGADDRHGPDPSRDRHAGRPGATGNRRRRRPLLAGIALVVAVLALGAAWVVASNRTPSSGTVVQGRGGHWTNVSADQLATALRTKDFTLLNVKTPYIGEISGTDLYIPYDQLTARASELPQDHGSRIVVYCRSGAESAIASQTLLDLGYTNIEDLDGGMNAWTASGRALVQLPRG